MSHNKFLYTLLPSPALKGTNIAGKLIDRCLSFARYDNSGLSEARRVNQPAQKELKLLKTFAAEKYFTKQSIAVDKVEPRSNQDWNANYVANTTMALDRRIKEIMVRKVIKSNGGRLSKEHMELFNSMTPSEEVAELLGDSDLFSDSLKAIEVEIGG